MHCRGDQPPASRRAPKCQQPVRPASRPPAVRVSTRSAALLPLAGAGQTALAGDGSTGTDASGNRILKDIGTHLRDLFKKSFKVRCAVMRRWAGRLSGVYDWLVSDSWWRGRG